MFKNLSFLRSLRTRFFSLGASKHRVTLVLVCFYLMVIVPVGTISFSAYQALLDETMAQYQEQARRLNLDIDNQLVTLIEQEAAKSEQSYTFEYFQKNNAHPIMGYFLIDDKGDLYSPLLPVL